MSQSRPRSIIMDPLKHGSPKTLEESIRRGWRMYLDGASDGATEAIHVSVRDYLSQKFTPDLFEREEFRKLWKDITGEDV